MNALTHRPDNKTCFAHFAVFENTQTLFLPLAFTQIYVSALCHKRNFAKVCKSMNSPYNFKRIHNCVCNTHSATLYQSINLKTNLRLQKN